jgi:hypothetical protein
MPKKKAREEHGETRELIGMQGDLQDWASHRKSVSGWSYFEK